MIAYDRELIHVVTLSKIGKEHFILYTLGYVASISLLYLYLSCSIALVHVERIFFCFSLTPLLHEVIETDQLFHHFYTTSYRVFQ